VSGCENPPVTELPQGFSAHVANIGIKDATDDFLVLAAEAPCAASAVFTRSRFAGPSVSLSRWHVGDNRLQAIAVISKNANVATGPAGEADAREVAAGVAAALGCPTEDVLLASTGVIGRRYPMDRIRAHLATLRPPFPERDALAAARAIMTTDTHPKLATAPCGAGVVVGIAKGVGMIEPNMATMLAFVLTDVDVSAAELDARFRSVVGRTFNAVSVDSDTSTSDTAAVLASGLAGPVDADELERALEAVCLDLTRQIARDGEGATKLLVVTVEGAADAAQAKRVAKSIVNSPLVKTAVHGADPNWGRVAMAVGKCEDDTDIDQDRVVIRFGDQEVFPTVADDPASLTRLATYMRGDEVRIVVDLGLDDGRATVYGCDLSDGYVRINADYTT
jgi:glutamate N-acetyltransferase/amino-acid N-acetyltransferase